MSVLCGSSQKTWMRSSRMVRAFSSLVPAVYVHLYCCAINMLSMPKSQQSWVRSQHPVTQWNLRDGRWSNVEKGTHKKFPCLGKMEWIATGRLFINFVWIAEPRKFSHWTGAFKSALYVYDTCFKEVFDNYVIKIIDSRLGICTWLEWFDVHVGVECEMVNLDFLIPNSYFFKFGCSLD